MQINFVFDASAQTAPTGFKQGLTIAANIIDAMILNPMSVNIRVGFGEDDGSALPAGALGEAQPAFGVLMSYKEVVAGLTAAATSADDASVLRSLPAVDPSDGKGFFVSAAQSIAWGAIPGSPSEIDGTAGFSSTLPFTYDPAGGIIPGTFDFVGVALHELTHALGRNLTSSWPTPLNLVSYGSNGTLDPNNADVRYLSLDGGKTRLGHFDAQSDPADLSLFGIVDPFSASVGPGAVFLWTSLDSRMMDILGYHTTTSIEVLNPVQPVAASLQGSHDQYVVADENGSLYVRDTIAGRDGTRILSNAHQITFTDGTGVFDPTGSAEDIAHLYWAAFHRAPDVAGLEVWASAIDISHVPLSAVANSLNGAPEFIRKSGPLSDSAFVQQLYQNALGRAADVAGARLWNGMLAAGSSRGAVTLAFSESQELKASMTGTAGDADSAEVYRLFQTTFNRPSDFAGANLWSAILANGAAPSQVAQDLTSSTEFQQRYGAPNVGDFVSARYENTFHRSADANGMQAWTDAMRGGMTEANVIVGIADSTESRALTAGATHANWVFVPAG